MGGDNLSDFTLRQMPKYYSKVKNKSACFWNRFPLRLKVILHGTICNDDF